MWLIQHITSSQSVYNNTLAKLVSKLHDKFYNILQSSNVIRTWREIVDIHKISLEILIIWPITIYISKINKYNSMLHEQHFCLTLSWPLYDLESRKNWSVIYITILFNEAKIIKIGHLEAEILDILILVSKSIDLNRKIFFSTFLLI